MTPLQLLASPTAREILNEAGADAMLRLPVPSGDRELLTMRQDEQTRELLRLLEILQQEVIIDPYTRNEVSREQMMARARAMSHRLMRTVFTVYLDDVLAQKTSPH